MTSVVEDVVVSEDEIDELEQEYGDGAELDEAEFDEAIEVLEEYNGDIESAIRAIADRAGADSELVFQYLDVQCHNILCDSDVRPQVPAAASLCASSLAGLALPAFYAGAIGILAAIASSKAVNAYCGYDNSPAYGTA